MSPSYTTPHYVLMVLSVAVAAIFVGGLVYLLIREKHKISLAKKEHIRAVLRRRRKGISAAPRSETPPFSPPDKSRDTVPHIQITTSFYSLPTRLLANTPPPGGKGGRVDEITHL